MGGIEAVSVFLYVEYRVTAIFLMIFLLLFLRLRYRKKVSALILAASFIVCSAVESIGANRVPRDGYFAMNTIIQIILCIGSALILDQYRDFRTLFTEFTGSLYVFPGNICGTMVWMVTGKGAAAIAAEILIHTVLLLILVRCLREPYQIQQREQRGGWFFLCFLPGFLYLAIYTMVAYPANIIEVPQNAPAVLLMLMVTLIVYIIVFQLLTEQRKESELMRNSDLLAAEVKGMVQELHVMKEAEEKTAILRHDMRHNIQIMSYYLQAGEYEKLNQAFDDVCKQIEETSREKYCDNIAVDSVVNYYAEQASEEHIDFQARLSLPADFRVGELEFVAVLSNLLENAVRGANKTPEGEEKRIEVYAREAKEKIILEISNTYSGSCTISKTTGFPVSSSGKGHGYGMRSAAAFAEKYSATFDYSVEGKFFVVRLLV